MNASPDSDTPQPSPESLRAENASLRRELQAKLLELQVTESQMSRVFSYLAGLYDLIPGLLLVLDGSLRVTRANTEASKLLGYAEVALKGRPLDRLLPAAAEVTQPFLSGCERASRRGEFAFRCADGSDLPVLLSSAAQYDEDGQLQSLLLVGLDLRERKRLELELRHAQKLESIGQLAAGVAHEINTPMQFISDNLHFIEQCANDLLALADGQRRREDLDLDFLRRRLPRAIERAHDGVLRVSRIVGAMRLFAHPGVALEHVDVNALIENAVTVSANAFKYIADLDLQLSDVPTVPAVRGDLGQVLLNLITNAAHAMETEFGERGERGLLRISTRHLPDQGQVEIAVEDNGCGIPEAIAHRVFDPFFTTKPVGTGTGQGLSISRAIVVDKLRGELGFVRVVPHGTRFLIRLPIAGPPKEGA
ncbi:two-component system sensor histidine kinase NtrB [Aquimonas voraii]|uniref:histidine kinase n=1 Tax=Aquimonas voraii TaxID=265719 RepID=A0A1G6T6A0_9GAMM|nr:ATP-binding protein [Aquimonas voraii]SDD24551.1 PAS domain S-box-containing protein [Aquimonas voraii]